MAISTFARAGLILAATILFAAGAAETSRASTGEVVA
jgi:hypothetical protein